MDRCHRDPDDADKRSTRDHSLRSRLDRRGHHRDSDGTDQRAKERDNSPRSRLDTRSNKDPDETSSRSTKTGDSSKSHKDSAIHDHKELATEHGRDALKLSRSHSDHRDSKRAITVDRNYAKDNSSSSRNSVSAKRNDSKSRLDEREHIDYVGFRHPEDTRYKKKEKSRLPQREQRDSANSDGYDSSSTQRNKPKSQRREGNQIDFDGVIDSIEKRSTKNSARSQTEANQKVVRVKPEQKSSVDSSDELKNIPGKPPLQVTIFVY